MKYCTFLMCLLAMPILAQTQEEMYEFYLKFDGDEVELSRDEEDKFLEYVELLYGSEEIIIELRRFYSRNQEESERITAQRRALMRELCYENRMDPSAVSYQTIQSRFEDSPESDVRVLYRHPSLRKVMRRKEVDYTDNRGFRVHCFATDAAYLKRADVLIYTDPAELKAMHLNTTSETGKRLEVVAVVSVTMPTDTTFGVPVKFQVPLRGVDETGFKEYVLLQQGNQTFAAAESKATIKRDDGLMLWKIEATSSLTMVIARIAQSNESLQFAAPEGFVITHGSSTGVAPYMNANAIISRNQLTASFHDLPDLANIYCEFELCDMHGNRYNIPRTPAKELMTSPLLTWMKRNDNTLPVQIIAQKK